MSDPAKQPLSRKDSSDSGDEANVPKDEGASSRVCPIIEEPPVAEGSDSSLAGLEGAVGGVDLSTSLSGPSRPTCLSPNWTPDDAAASSDSGKKSPKKSPVVEFYHTVKGKINKVVGKISPTKKSPTGAIPKKDKSPKDKSLKEKSPNKDKSPKEKKPKKDKSPKEKKPKKEKSAKPDKPPKKNKGGNLESEKKDIKSLPQSSTGFQPYQYIHYDVKSVKSVEETEYTEMAEPMSPCEVTSIPPDSLPTSPRGKGSDDEGGTPIKQPRFDFKEDSDKDDDDDKDKAA